MERQLKLKLLVINLHDVAVSDLISQSLRVNITQKNISLPMKLSLSKTSVAVVVGMSGPDTACATRTDLEHVSMLLEKPR